jgi:hypothetical protein
MKGFKGVDVLGRRVWVKCISRNPLARRRWTAFTEPYDTLLYKQAYAQADGYTKQAAIAGVAQSLVAQAIQFDMQAKSLH